MRSLFILTMSLFFGFSLLAQEPKIKKVDETRFGVMVDLAGYSQATPKEALAAVIKAIERERFEYLLAHLMEPNEIEAQLKLNQGSVDKLVKLVQKRLNDDAGILKELKKIYAEGEFNDIDDRSTATHKDIKNKQITFQRIGDRWFMENQKTDPKAKDKN